MKNNEIRSQRQREASWLPLSVTLLVNFLVVGSFAVMQARTRNTIHELGQQKISVEGVIEDLQREERQLNGIITETEWKLKDILTKRRSELQETNEKPIVIRLSQP
ncbi:MAG: hypothetical protein ACOYMN_09075 [Roseimicrobium sp.]